MELADRGVSFFEQPDRFFGDGQRQEFGLEYEQSVSGNEQEQP